jgi:hypothetical protein
LNAAAERGGEQPTPTASGVQDATTHLRRPRKPKTPIKPKFQCQPRPYIKGRKGKLCPKVPYPCQPRPYIKGRKGKLCPKQPREFPKNPRTRQKNARQIDKSGFVCKGVFYYLKPPLALPRTQLLTILKSCTITNWRPNAKQIREANREGRHNMEQSRKLQEHFVKLLTKEGQSQVPTLNQILGPKPKQKKPSRPQISLTPAEKTSLRPLPAPTKCRSVPGQGNCDCCAPLGGPFKCATSLCGGPSGDYYMAGNFRINAKAVQPGTIDQLIKMINSPGVCGSPEGSGFAALPPWWKPWNRPAALQPKPSLPQGGVSKLPIGPLTSGPLAPIPLPGSPGLIPGQLQGEVCAPVGFAPFNKQVFLCGGAGQDVFISAGQRRPVSSFPSSDALIAWVNSL